MTSANNSIGLTELLETINARTEGNSIYLGEILEIFEDRGFGPLLMAPSLIVLLPTGGIPGVPSVCAIFICLVAGQHILGKKRPWLPNSLEKRSLSKSLFQGAVAHAKPATRLLDRLFSPRLKWLFIKPLRAGMAMLCVALALLMIPLELVPFAARLPALSIGLFGIALSVRDGVLVIAALAPLLTLFYFSHFILASLNKWFF